MARIIYSDIVSSIKGSIGGLTFNNNKAGPGVRLRPVNKFAPTVVQNEYKSQYIYLSGVWNSFSTAQKDDWNASVVGETFLNAWGEIKLWSGFNRFLSVNIGRLLVGLSIIEDSTSVDTPASPDVNGFTVNGSVIQVSFTSTSSYSYIYYMFYMSPPNRLAYNKQRTQLRLIHAQVMSGSTSIDLTSSFESAFGLSYPVSAVDGAFSLCLGVRVFDSSEGNWTPYVLRFEPFLDV